MLVRTVLNSLLQIDEGAYLLILFSRTVVRIKDREPIFKSGEVCPKIEANKINEHVEFGGFMKFFLPGLKQSCNGDCCGDVSYRPVISIKAGKIDLANNSVQLRMVLYAVLHLLSYYTEIKFSKQKIG